MDRKNWKFGQLNTNALVIGVTYRNVAFLILFSLLPKRGNSNTSERLKMIDKYIELFGIETIGCQVTDREFIGERWVEYLNDKSMSCHLRIRAKCHMMHLIRIERMFAIVIMAFAWAYRVGIYKDEQVKAIRI